MYDITHINITKIKMSVVNSAYMYICVYTVGSKNIYVKLNNYL